MRIRDARPDERAEWNEFVARHFGPVGAFFQSWEWGEFQRSLGMRTLRLVLEDDGGTRLGLTLALHRKLPLGFEYVYLPRGPVLPQEIWDSEPRLRNALAALREALMRRYPRIAFIRMEPAISTAPPMFAEPPFRVPSYYLQPRFNHTIDLTQTEEEILQRFSPQMRNNVRKAARKGVSVESKAALTEEEWRAFAAMRRDTERRAGKSIFPTERYFHLLTQNVPSRWYVARRNQALAGINLVLFFAETATYLFGASFREHLASKISPALHWHAMKDAKREGYRWYDLGGVDRRRWPTLTYFKEQFGGTTVRYMGMVYLVLKPVPFMAYSLIQTVRR
jgi:lipid II:glycine glycyltransferase (peptidoglycan interpeptide bridge formation enzyme)